MKFYDVANQTDKSFIGAVSAQEKKQIKEIEEKLKELTDQINENISSGFMGSNEATELAFVIMSLIFMLVFFISLYLYI